MTANGYPANLPLGTMAETDYDQIVLTMQRGDRVALYTDGITEWCAVDGVEFGADGLRATLRTEDRQLLAIVWQDVLAALRRHVTPLRCDDGLTLLLTEAL